MAYLRCGASILVQVQMFERSEDPFNVSRLWKVLYMLRRMKQIAGYFAW